MQATANRKFFNLMNLKIFNKLISCTRGCLVKGRTVDANEQETWMKHKTLLCRLNGLEKAISERSVSNLLNRTIWFLIVDIELI